MSKPQFDESRWPILFVQWPQEATSDEIATHFTEMATYVTRRQRFGVVLDATHGRKMDAGQRDLVRRRLAEVAVMGKEYLVGVAYVSDSTLVRGALTAIHWLTPKLFESQVFATKEEGFAWIDAQLHAPGT